jgi:hypothetical protein
VSYYPFLKVPGCFGSITLFNFAPNNWERNDRQQRYINATWAEGSMWRSEHVGTLPIGESATLSALDIAKEDLLSERGIFLSLTTEAMPSKCQELPSIKTHPSTSAPAWRATLRLSTENATTCYQGEIDPFLPKGSLLSFGPFIQYGIGIENFLILVNIEKSPLIREEMVEIFDAATMVKRGESKMLSNDTTVISLDHLGFTKTDLPLIICRSMSAIPLYFSRTTDGAHLSLEHTHPPASLVVHGERWKIQKSLKNHWFSRVVQ